MFLANLGTRRRLHRARDVCQELFRDRRDRGGRYAEGFTDPAALAAAFKASGAALACLCSSDKVYAGARRSGREGPSRRRRAKHIYLAGRPGEQEAALRAAGVSDFIFAGGDALATLQASLSADGVNMTSATKPVLTGGCQCGAIRFALSAAPVKVSICHCRMCQKASGAPFASFAEIEHGDFAWTRGKPAAFRSSSLAERDFCADCGTPLSFRRIDGPRIEIMTGAFDRPGPGGADPAISEPNPGSAGWSRSPICRARPRCRITARKSLTASSATSIRTMIEMAMDDPALHDMLERPSCLA